MSKASGAFGVPFCVLCGVEGGGAVLDLSFVCPDMGISSASTTASSSGWFASNPMEASDAGDGK
eukprot:4295830-Amphidinium_carterae.2